MIEGRLQDGREVKQTEKFAGVRGNASSDCDKIHISESLPSKDVLDNSLMKMVFQTKLKVKQRKCIDVRKILFKIYGL